MVTIPGTLLQNRRALRLYHTIWASIGLEMEGVYFVQALNKARVMGIITPSVQSRFLYYTSDLPLAAGASLAKPMCLEELIPPFYAITRIFLLKCLMCDVCVRGGVAETTSSTDSTGYVEDAFMTSLETARLSEDDELSAELRPRVSSLGSNNSLGSNDIGDIGAGGGAVMGGTNKQQTKQHLKHFQNVVRAVARFKLSGSPASPTAEKETDNGSTEYARMDSASSS